MDTKVCIDCGYEKDLNEFGTNKRAKDGKNSKCKVCINKYTKAHRKPRQEFIVPKSGKKLCNKCGDEKPLTEFGKNSYTIDGKERYCKLCVRKYYNSKTRILSPHEKIYNRIRARLRLAIKSIGIRKTRGTFDFLGCDHITLMEWLQWSGEVYDPNFNILDYDTDMYHIDHIKTFEDVSKGIYTLEEVAHYTNLQVLPATINESKGGNSWEA